MVLPRDRLEFIDSVVVDLDSGKEFAQRQFPDNTDKPLVTVAYSNEKDQLGGKLLINTFREDGPHEVSWHLTDGMRATPGKCGGAGFAYDKAGNRQPEDHILGGMSGPEFKSASEVARFIISNSLKQSMPYGLQQAA